MTLLKTDVKEIYCLPWSPPQFSMLMCYLALNTLYLGGILRQTNFMHFQLQCQICQITLSIKLNIHITELAVHVLFKMWTRAEVLHSNLQSCTMCTNHQSIINNGQWYTCSNIILHDSKLVSCNLFTSMKTSPANKIKNAWLHVIFLEMFFSKVLGYAVASR